MLYFNSLAARMFALAVGGSVAVCAAPAEARGQLAGFRGPNGSVLAGRHVSREPGSIEVRRGFRTADGRGVKTTRSTSWGERAIHNEVERIYADGRTMTREGSLVRNGDGSVSRNRTRTGPAGNSQSGWSTIYRTEDGFGRERGASTSSGRGYQAKKDVSVSPDSVSVDRSLTTNSGRTMSRTRTYQRRR